MQGMGVTVNGRILKLLQSMSSYFYRSRKTSSSIADLLSPPGSVSMATFGCGVRNVSKNNRPRHS